MTGQKTGAKITVPPARPPKLTLAPAPLWHRAAEWTLRCLAISAVVAIVLILVFIAKEAAPLFYSAAVRAEVTLTKMWVPQLWPGYDEAASIWQPVSEIPKFGIWPLIVGTLKVTDRRDVRRGAARRRGGALRRRSTRGRARARS